MIKNVIFDMGGVLIRWNPEDILQLYDLNAEEKDILRRELFRGVEWIQMDRGTLSQEDAAAAVYARIPEGLRDTVNDIVHGWFQRYLVPMPGMAELVAELKAKGYRVFLLSNAGKNLRIYFPRIPGAACFDGLMVSAEEGLLKPSHEIYQRLFEKFELEPSECWFVDDAPANVEGALCTGMGATVFYGDVPRLRRELRRAGIDCGE